jgi:hypothetical protein
LGLATDLQENDIIPQYSNTEAAVYTNFAKFLLTRGQPRDLPLGLLAVCFCRPQWLDREKLQAKIKTLDDWGKNLTEFNTRLEMPSGVPDRTVEKQHRPILVFEDILGVACSSNATLRMPSPKHAEVLADNT